MDFIPRLSLPSLSKTTTGLTGLSSRCCFCFLSRKFARLGSETDLTLQMKPSRNSRGSKRNTNSSSETTWQSCISLAHLSHLNDVLPYRRPQCSKTSSQYKTQVNPGHQSLWFKNQLSCSSTNRSKCLSPVAILSCRTLMSRSSRLWNCIMRSTL